ncbi:MAG: sugar transferase [Sphingomonadales bacterium]|nr:sugar transferase [Sphingomonadales bacterium]
MHKLDFRQDESVVEPTTVVTREPAALVLAMANPHEQALITAPANDGLRTRTRGGLIELQRLADVVCALVLIVVLAPVLVVVALLVLVTDPGPVLFTHWRLGRDGRPFGCLKFRTMRTDAEAILPQLLIADPALREEWERDHKLAVDPRVTPLGRFLRLSSLDELPQLFNLLRGDMTLVGPRPIVATELHHYGRYAAHYFSVRPGLTGLWQVSGRSSTTYRRRVAADVYYVRSKSWLLDTRILLCTLPAVLAAEGSC